MNRFSLSFGETMRAIATDRVAMLSLVGALVLYSFFYPAAYQHQVARDLPLVVVNLDHSSMSRELIRKLDAVQAIHLVGIVESMPAARGVVEAGEAEAVLSIPAGFERDILRGVQGQLALFGNGAVLGRASIAMQGAALAITAFGQEVALQQAQFMGIPASPPLRLIERPLFNTVEGYGSSIVPGVAALIVQQSLLIGVAVMAATRRERYGKLRLSRPGFFGIASAFSMIGMISLLYFSGLIFWFQDYPRAGNLSGLLLAGALFISSVVAFALFCGSFFRTRERAFQLITITSLPLFFLSNLSWPVEATPDILVYAAQLLPSTAGINAVVKLNQMGARLPEVFSELVKLAVLTIFYGSLALWRYRPGPAKHGSYIENRDIETVTMVSDED
ncbi:ABC transporter permease [Marinicella gelatinilytica]|uniref:ABC transporter permease n=1 Tax=Marinicella gelatinilytica TaxID=2996017 RepID=UPI002260B08C|nr:ABC transporter permease [Marinicella gelatinilytica]MCX7546236.1 ABC transporter permease [Marinicella gelatinilytica]